MSYPYHPSTKPSQSVSSKAPPPRDPHTNHQKQTIRPHQGTTKGMKTGKWRQGIGISTRDRDANGLPYLEFGQQLLPRRHVLNEEKKKSEKGIGGNLNRKVNKG
ncbi:predicted protein [Histoplasma capsulatum G186AR]|uniref:Uncharacterized protein n=1 Tax=Ajellomyces capsulatus (strain G186AR / H82 / ATCC MYA-2454 / RMSCC 2432) TaxID=447093 RepID=C0NAF7_AJECG|nr:uncharacterized protein HCBG_00103 [Histoplasma capsulatum G186AR]EEH10648.1 predicted protein [Histoplasma capsulatum G186AR]